jgi:hypothetical protein
MALHSSVSFTPLHNAAVLIACDQLALASQLTMCHTERRRWRHLGAWAERVQRFVAQRLMSSLVVAASAFGAVSWLIG